jgi:hypothetical protein
LPLLGHIEVVAATRSVRELKGRFGKPRRAVAIAAMTFGTGAATAAGTTRVA